MIDDNLRKELVKGLDNLEEHLDKYTQGNKLFEQWRKSWFRWKCWILGAVFIVSCQFGAAAYGATLPGDHYLDLPFFACFLLTMVGIQIPRREAKACGKAMRALEKRDKDEYYTLVTGQKRR